MAAATIAVFLGFRQIVDNPFRHRCRASGCRPMRFFVGVAPAWLLLSRPARVLLPDGWPSTMSRTTPVDPWKAVRSCDSAAHPAVRAASSGTCPFPKFSASASRGVRATILRSTSIFCGSALESMASTACPQNNRKHARFQVKTELSGNVLCRRPAISLPLAMRSGSPLASNNSSGAVLPTAFSSANRTRFAVAQPSRLRQK